MNNLTKDLNITKHNTETELSKINWVLKESDSSQHFFGAKYEKQKERNKWPHKRQEEIFLKTRNFRQILELE